MNNYYNYLIPEERPAWRNAYEIEIAARKHEELRVRTMQEEPSWALLQMQVEADRRAGFLAFITRPMQMLAALIG